MRRGTNLPAVGHFNQAVVLDLIRRAPHGLSRVEMATTSGLSAQTIANGVKKLIEAGLVAEAGTQVQGRGKPPVILTLVPSGRHAVGVHLDPAYITVVLLDLAGNVVADRRIRSPRATSPGAVIDEIAAHVEGLVETAGVDPDTVVGVGVASPGPIDRRRGVVVDPPLLVGWRDVPLRDELSRRLRRPVLLEKDVNAAALAEIWMIDGEERSDFFFLYFGSGIGMSIAVDGEVLGGTTGNAGTGGALFVPSASLPPHRQSDMLGHVATASFLVEQAVSEGVLPGDPVDVDAGFAALLQRAAEGSPAAEGIVDRAVENIAAALLSAVNLLDIQEVVLGGPYWPVAEDVLLPKLRRCVENSPYRLLHSVPRLETSELGDDVVAIGAAALVLDAALSPRPAAMLLNVE